jgi:hypothetical protein
MFDDILAPEKIYNTFINVKSVSFWSTPSDNGIKIMEDCKQQLLDQFNSSELFSGSLRMTYITVGQMVEFISKRINRWQSFLDSQKG